MNRGLIVKEIAIIHCKRSGAYSDEYWSVKKVYSFGDMLYMWYRDKEKAYTLANRLCSEYNVTLHESTDFS